MSDKLKAALDRVQDSYETCHGASCVYNLSDEFNFNDDLFVVLQAAREHLAEHPADDDPSDDVKVWVQKAPPALRTWLTSVPVRNFIRERRKAAFQLQGAYDGAMSEDCKQLFAKEYQVLSSLLDEVSVESER